MAINEENKKFIEERVQYRDIQKLWDYFLETVTDTVIDELPVKIFNGEDEEAEDNEGFETLDYIIEKTLAEFNVAPVKRDEEKGEGK